MAYGVMISLAMSVSVVYISCTVVNVYIIDLLVLVYFWSDLGEI